MPVSTIYFRPFSVLDCIVKKLFTVASVMSLLGCFFQTHDYYYASLEDVADAKVVKRKKLTTKELSGNSTIPTEYSIFRSAYTLDFSIEDEPLNAHFYIVVTGQGDTKLSLKPRPDITVSLANGEPCGRNYLTENDPVAMFQNQVSPYRYLFVWIPECEGAQFKKQISFAIIDESGNVIAIEAIPFEIKRDGKYTITDGF